MREDDEGRARKPEYQKYAVHHDDGPGVAKFDREDFYLGIILGARNRRCSVSRCESIIPIFTRMGGKDSRESISSFIVVQGLHSSLAD